MNDLLWNFLKTKVPLWVLVGVAAVLVLMPVVSGTPKFLDALGDLRDRWRLGKLKKVLEYILDVVVRHYQGYPTGAGGLGDLEFYSPRERLIGP